MESANTVSRHSGQALIQVVSNGDKLTVFLVEDSELLRSQIRRSIDETGSLRTVGWAASADDAIRQIRRLKPDAVVVDLQLDQGTGWDVDCAVRPVTPYVIVLTNHASEEYRAEAEARGIPYFFDKTTQFAEFLTCLTGLAAVSSASAAR